MKFCPTCHTQYPEDANFCPQESCATPEGPQRLQSLAAQPPARFQPTERIGGGRTGEVWRAKDAQTGAEVAYKVVAPEVIGTPAVQARAEREFKQLARVSSPKIAAIIDCEKLPNGGLAVAMELVQGGSLEDLLASGPMPFERAKGIIAQVGLALLEAQKVGLVHRDVSPKNILVAPSGEVKVINFPLARPVNDRVAGEPSYISPEQVQGKPVDQRSNTYSLAATLYHMLTGEPPFVGANVQAVLDMHVSTPVLPPSQRRPGLAMPADADKLLLKALDKSSSRRHLTLRLFLNELEALKDQPTGAAKPAREAGLAKTMMFGGNQAEIARMVAEARAAKAGSPVSSTLVQPPGAQPVLTPPSGAPAQSVVPPQPARPLTPAAGAAVGPTVTIGVSPPQPGPQAPPIAQRTMTPAQAPAASYQRAPTPASVRPAAQRPLPAAPASQPAAPTAAASPARPPAAIKPHEAGKAPPPKAGAAFRETLWFKQGDVEQMVADAKAKLQAAGKGTGDAPVLGDDGRPLEDRYADDGSVTVEDRKKFSLRTGGTATALPAAPSTSVPGEKINEDEIVGELSTGRRTLILVIAAVVILALIVVIAMMVKGKGQATAPTPAPVGAVAAVKPAAPPGTGNEPAALGQAHDAGVPTGSSPGGGASPAKTPAAGLGSAGGTTRGDATSGAKPTAAKKPPVTAKKKAAPVKRSKHRRQ